MLLMKFIVKCGIHQVAHDFLCIKHLLLLSFPEGKRKGYLLGLFVCQTVCTMKNYTLYLGHKMNSNCGSVHHKDGLYAGLDHESKIIFLYFFSTKSRQWFVHSHTVFYFEAVMFQANLTVVTPFYLAIRTLISFK